MDMDIPVISIITNHNRIIIVAADNSNNSIMVSVLDYT